MLDTTDIRLAHRFRGPNGIANPKVVDGAENTEEVPGGFISASGTISVEDLRADRDVLKYGTLWETYVAQTRKIVWAGRLLDPEENTDGTVTLNAKGWATLADKAVKRLLYETNNMDEWHPADEDPFNFKNDVKHTRVNGVDFTDVTGTSAVVGSNDRRLNVKGDIIKKNLTGLDSNETYEVQVFGRKTAAGTNNSKVYAYIYNETDNANVQRVRRKLSSESTDQIAALNFKPLAGKTYSIRLQYRDVSDTNEPILSHVFFGKTPEITSDKIQAEVQGKRLLWRIDKGTKFNGGEATGMVFWAYDQDLRRIAFKINKDRPQKDFVLQLLGGKGPDGALTFLTSWSLEENGPTVVDYRIRGGDYDMLMLRLKRQEGKNLKNEHAQKFWLTGLRVGAIAVEDEFTVSDVARDIAHRMGIRARGVEDYHIKATPLDVQDGTFADVLNEMSLLADAVWRIVDHGNGPVLEFVRPRQNKWRIPEDGYINADLIPLERYTAVRVPYRMDGGVRDWVIARASRDVIARHPENFYDVELDDPLPGKETARMLAEGLVDRLSEVRFTGSAELIVAQNEKGVTVPAAHISAGDMLIYNKNRLPIKSLRRRDDGVVELEFSDHSEALEAIFAKRTHLLALGKPNASATLFPISPARPADVENVAINFKLREQKTSAEYTAAITWEEVIEDVRGNLSFIESYEVQLRPWDDTLNAGAGGVPSDGEIRHKIKKFKEEEDDPADPDTGLRAVFPNLERPRRWKYQARARAIDVLQRKGEWSPWTVAALAPTQARPEPPTPTGVTLSFDTVERDRRKRNRALVIWNEVGQWDVPGGDREDDVAQYIVQLQHCTSAGVDIGDPRKAVVGAKDADANTTNRVPFLNIKKGHYYKARVRAVDRFHRRGPWSAYTTHGTPSDNTPPPVPTNLVFDIDQHRAHVNFDAPVDTDDVDADLQIPHQDIDGFQIQVSNRSDYNKSLSTYWREERFTRRSGATFRIKKPGTATYYCRVRSVDASGNKSAWVTTTNNRQDPPTPASAPTMTFDVADQTVGSKLYANISFTYGGTYTDDDIEYFQVVFETDDTNLFATPKRRREDVDYEGTGAHVSRFGTIKKGRYCRARYRCVDGKGHKSGWSPWTTTAQAAFVQTLPQPLNVTIDDGGERVGIKWDVPMDPEDPEIPDQRIHHFEVQRSTNNTFTAIVNYDRYVIDDHRRWVADGSTNYWLRIRSADGLGNFSSWVALNQQTGRVIASTDGIIPATPETPTLTASGTYLLAEWPAVTNTTDIVTYNVYIGDESGFFVDAGTKVGQVDGTSLIIKNLPSGLGTPVPGTQYFVKVVAKDKDGTSAPSPEGSTVFGRIQPSDTDIIPGTGNILANPSFENPLGLLIWKTTGGTFIDTVAPFHGNQSLKIVVENA